MAEQLFDVVFEGTLVAGASVEQVKANLAKLFNANPEKLNHLFTGNRVVIKKGLDLAGADKYQAVLRRAGAVVEVVEQTAQNTVGATAKSSQNASAAESPPAEEKSIKPPVAPSNLTVAEVGATLVEPTPPPAVNFDTTHLDLAEVGVDLVAAEAVAAPQYDLSGFSLDPLGIDLAEPKPVKPANFDTSTLSLSDL